MKVKTSVALGQETIGSMGELMHKGKFRNKSHIMEFAVEKLLVEENEPR
ncbi:hypothetical protein HYU13_04635 [Candidatus Woesearchaeota archaeon]|nr:hypothetical protein [Candidatus Woesearchaeota archaeon]